MTKSEFRRIQKLFAIALIQAESEAIDDGIDITSSEYEEAFNLLREKILNELDLTSEKYEKLRKSFKIPKKPIDYKDLINTPEIPVIPEILSPEKIRELINEAISQIPKPTTTIINKIEKIVEKPQIIKTIEHTKEIVKESDITKLEEIKKDIQYLQENFQNIKIPEPINIESIKKDLLKQSADYTNEQLAEMPNFRALAMGLQGQIDKLKSDLNNENLFDRTGTVISPHTAGDSLQVDGGFLSTGVATGFTIPSGAGTRFMWIPDKGAFRAGLVLGTEWDSTNIGADSTAFGVANTASGDNSFATGSSNTASGSESMAAGQVSVASGGASFALGEEAFAEGQGSFAIGYYSHAQGIYSFAGGKNNMNDTTSLVAGTDIDTPGAFAFGYAQGGKTLKALGTASFAMGQDVNALQNNSFALGSDFTNNTVSSFAVGFGAIDLSVASGGNVTIGTTLATSPTLTLQAKGSGGIPTLKFMRDGAGFNDFQFKDDGGVFYFQQSSDDGATWEDLMSIEATVGGFNFYGRNLLTTGTLGAGAITGTSIIKSGGTSSQFLKANGSVDSSTYLTAANLNTTGGVANGGTGRASFTANSIVAGGTTTTGQLQPIANSSITGSILKSNGASGLPGFSFGGLLLDQSSGTNYMAGVGTSTYPNAKIYGYPGTFSAIFYPGGNIDIQGGPGYDGAGGASNGGNFTGMTGRGGDHTIITTGTALGKNGGAMTLGTGRGGNASGGTVSNTGGNSGSFTISTGNAGTGATANGTVGDIIFDLGANGTNTPAHRFKVGTVEQINLTDGVLAPTTTNDIDLGDSTHIFKNFYANNYFAGSVAGIDMASGTPKGVVISKGIITAATSVTPVADGTYPVYNDGVTSGQVTGFTTSGGIITAITVVP